MPKSQCVKGAQGERDVVKLAQSFGLTAKRTWETAQSTSEESRACDVLIGGHPFQVKRRAAGYGSLYKTVAHTSGAFVRDDKGEWLVVIPAETFLRMFEYFHREP